MWMVEELVRKGWTKTSRGRAADVGARASSVNGRGESAPYCYQEPADANTERL
ncbi:MAG: hypothetical protein H0W99_16705 [Acidobacteria bacterium]|nr:hypothetical protein [Acidobacteriota bacterium]